MVGGRVVILAILAIVAMFGVPALIAWYGWIVPFTQSRRIASEIPNCYYRDPCGKCRTCEHDSVREYTIDTIPVSVPAYAIDNIPSLCEIRTNNIRIGKVV